MRAARPAVQVCFGGMQRDLLLYRYKGLDFSVRGDAATAPLPALATDFDRHASSRLLPDVCATSAVHLRLPAAKMRPKENGAAAADCKGG